MNNKFKVIGLMSGTSLDGLDLAYCKFEKTEGIWKFAMEECETIRYPKKLSDKLSQATNLSGEELVAMDSHFGQFLGQSTLAFIKKNKLKADFISSHGHTIFHQPKNGFTYQIGNGNIIHAITEIPVVYDFRSLDVALKGQGAPLVPIGDELLFSDYDFCLNLGGIANISMKEKNRRIAFDVCFTNMVFNYLMQRTGKAFDNHGQKAASGSINKLLLRKFLSVYAGLRKKRPALGKEIFDQKFKPLLNDKKILLEDVLATAVEVAAIEIVRSAGAIDKEKTMLCTGGGVYNSFLISRILHHVGDSISIIIPDDKIVKFKEALIFAFLGVLRVNKENNCLQSVTGAVRDSSAGVTVGF